MYDGHVAFEVITFAAYLAVCAVMLQRARKNPKKYVFLLAFAALLAYQSLELLGEFGVSTILHDLRYVFKTTGYALLLGTFIHITGAVKDPRKAGAAAIIGGIAYLGALIAESYWMGVGFRTLCVWVAMALVAITIAAYLKAPQRAMALLFGAVGAGFMAMDVVMSVLYPNALLHLVFCSAVGALFIVAGTLLFYPAAEPGGKVGTQGGGKQRR